MDCRDIFEGQMEGFFIDAGAYDGYTNNVTYAFEAMGWTAVSSKPTRPVTTMRRTPFAQPGRSRRTRAQEFDGDDQVHGPRRRRSRAAQPARRRDTRPRHGREPPQARHRLAVGVGRPSLASDSRVPPARFRPASSSRSKSRCVLSTTCWPGTSAGSIWSSWMSV